MLELILSIFLDIDEKKYEIWKINKYVKIKINKINLDTIFNYLKAWNSSPSKKIFLGGITKMNEIVAPHQGKKNFKKAKKKKKIHNFITI